MSPRPKKKSTTKREGESADDAILRVARSQFKSGIAARGPQLKRENEDIQFYNGEQWPADVVASRAGQEANNGMPPIPARPCLVINKQREPVRQVLNMERNSDLGFELVPADDFAGLSEPVDSSEIELREGLVRRIQRESSAASARTWGFERGVIAGSGYWGVMTRYGEGRTRDQEIYVERFWDQSAVMLVGAFEPDGSDAEAAFVGLPMPYDQYVAEYPKTADGEENPTASDDFTDSEFGGFAKDYPDWFGTDKDGARWVRVMRYFYYQRDSRELAMFDDGQTFWVTTQKGDRPEDVLPENVPKESYTTRTVVEKRVKMCKINGATILEKIDWEGKYIPVIKYVAEQLQPVNGEMREEGMVRPGRDAQRGSNYMISKGVEMVGLTPIPPLILDPESIAGFEQWYYNANTRTLPFLPQRTRGDDGREFREAHRPNVDPNIQPVAAFIQLFDESIQSTMSVHDPSTGKVDPRLKSGKAIQAVIAQDAHGTSQFIDNLGRSIRYEAMIINDLLFPIYGRPGRITKMLTKEGDPQAVMMQHPHIVQDGRPVQAPDDPNAKSYKLTKDAQFNVAIKIVKNHDLRREQVTEFLGGLIESDPSLMGVYGDMLFKSLDVPDHLEFAERAKAMLAPPIQQLLESKKQGKTPLPPEVMQQMQQGQKLIEGMSKTIEQLEKDKAADTAKQQAETQRAQLKLQTDKELKGMELAAKADEAEKERANKVLIARISAGAKGTPADPAAAAEEERMSLDLEQKHELGMAAADAAHEERMAQMQQQHDRDLADQAAQHTQAGMVAEAALQPPPEAQAGA